jgi:NADH-quinone oxidoreductase subunit N
VILDFSSPIDYLWALLPEVVLAATGLLVLLIDVFQRGDRSGPSRAWVRWTAVAGVLIALLANGYLLEFDVPVRSGMIAMDSFRVAMNFVILGATVLALLLAFDYLRREGLDIGEFYFLVLMAAIGMMLLSGSRDLIVVFVSLELMSLAVYVLTGFNRKDPRSAEGALKYFLMGAFASAFLLYGIALLFGATGSTNLALVTSEVARGASEGNFLLYAGVALVVVGFAFKVSAVPFHMWTPDAYEGAPTPVTGYMAAGVKAAGFAALLRIVTIELAPAASVWGLLIHRSRGLSAGGSGRGECGRTIRDASIPGRVRRHDARRVRRRRNSGGEGGFAIRAGGLPGPGVESSVARSIARGVSAVACRVPANRWFHRQAVPPDGSRGRGSRESGGNPRPHELRVLLLLPQGHLEDVLRRGSR